MSDFQHRPTGSKQQNKKFKSRKRTKGQLNRRNAGRVELRNSVKSKPKVTNRLARRNKIKQLRDKKMNGVDLRKQIGKINQGPPLNVAILGLSAAADICEIERKLFESSEYTFPDDWSVSNTGISTIEVPRYRSHINFYKIIERDLTPVLDIIKVADVMLFIVDVEEGIDEIGHDLMKYIKALCLPTPIFVLQGLGNLQPKNQKAAKNYVTKECQDLVSDNDVRVLPLENENDGLQILRFISQIKLKDIHWRTARPYMLVDNIDFIPNDNHPGYGSLVLSGHLRGNKLDPNNLVVLPDYGEFQLEKVEVYPNRSSNIMQDFVEFFPDPENCQTLERMNNPDLTEMEQTWPTPEELLAAEETTKTVNVPAGFSQYQAAWIPEDDFSAIDSSVDSSDDFDVDIDVDDIELREYLESLKEYDDQMKDISYSSEDEENMTEEERRQKRLEDELEDIEFPDEVDYDFSIPARVRFQKYRGLKSFRATPWDPKENLPFDYAKIYQFENPKRTKKYVFKKHRGIEPRSYVKLYLKNVSQNMLKNHPNQYPIVVGGLLKYENKMSVVNALFRRHKDYDEPIKSKDEMIIHCGFRRYKARPIFSDHNITCDKFKYKRFLHNGVHVASFYAPITFPPAPLLAIKDKVLIGTGTVESIDPDRIILKKVILTGNAIKFNNNRVVVKDMFNNPEDIAWFKPVELWTKYGRSGHIKESVGIHGHMKCIFDGQIGSQDTICMSLYKRVYPKWAELPEPDVLKVP